MGAAGRFGGITYSSIGDVVDREPCPEKSQLRHEDAQAEAETCRLQGIEVRARHAAWVKAGCPGRQADS